jgi:RNA polymerase sigma-70 factor, ECF subfamily
MTAPTDEALMGALAHGDDHALDALMDRWQVPLRGFLYRRIQNEQDAMDLAQETFVRIYTHRARFRVGARFSTWMFQIALNLARSRARWHRRRPTVSLDAVFVDGGPAPEPADGATPADRLSQAEKIAAVRGAIAGLPDELRDIVILSESGERSHAEIAEILSTTAKAIESRLYRARQRLRKALTGFFV